MNIKGKKIAFLGDSITSGVGTSSLKKVYWKVIERKTGAVCSGFGISGTRIAKQIVADPDAVHDRMHFITRIDKIDKNTDIIMVFGGVNDFAHGDAPLGKMSDRKDDTFYGACHLLYERLVESFPKADIFIITPLHCAEEDNRYNAVGFKSNIKLSDYVNIIVEVASYYSLAVLDLYKISGIKPSIKVHREMFMPDGIHPNDAGNEKIANKIIAFLSSM